MRLALLLALALGSGRKLDEKEWRALSKAVKEHCAHPPESDVRGCQHALDDGISRGLNERWNDGELEVSCNCYDSNFVVRAKRIERGWRVLRVRTSGCCTPKF